MYLKQYTAKEIKNVCKDGKEHLMACMSATGYYFISTARFYAGRYFGACIFPSHEA